MPSALDRVLGGVSSHKKTSWGYRCRCPAHEDKKASLSVKEESDGKVLLYCHAGCSVEAICESLKLELRDLMPERVGAAADKWPKISATYDYFDEKGMALFQVVRYEPKNFKQRKSLGDGKYSWVLNGVRRVPYQLPKVLSAANIGGTIFVCEGEKDVQAIEKAGGTATCNAGGAGKWHDEYSPYLAGAQVVVVADKDEPGRKHAQQVAESVRPHAKSVKIVEALEGKDAYDHLLAGKALDQLVRRSDLEPQVGHDIRYVDEFEIEEPSYFWEPYLPKRAIVLLDAAGYTGKTSLVMALAAGYSNGQLPCAAGPCEPLRTLYYGREDDGGDLHAVYKATGGKKGCLGVFQKPFPLNDAGMMKVEETINHHGFNLVVFDPLFAYLEGLIKDIKDNIGVLHVLTAMTELARSSGVTIINIRHIVKMVLGVESQNLGLGTTQFRDSHRGQLLLRKHPDPGKPFVRVLTQERATMRTLIGPPVAWERKNDQFFWIGAIDDPFRTDGPMVRPGPQPIEMERASDWLAAALSNGPRKQSTVIALSQELSPPISRGTLFRAAASLGLHSGTEGKYKTWSLDPIEADLIDYQSVYRGGD